MSKKNKNSHSKRFMNLLMLAFIASSMLWLSACGVIITSHEDLITIDKTAELPSFHSLKISSSFRVEVRPGDSYKVELEADQNILKEHLIMEVRDKTLHLGLTPFVTFRGIKVLKAIIQIPNLQRIHLSGSSYARVYSRNCSGHIELRMSGASRADVELSAQSANIRLSGASTLRGRISIKEETTWKLSGASSAKVEGNSDKSKFELSGASDLLLNSFCVNKASVRLSGASKAILHVKSYLNSKLSGASNLKVTIQGKLDANLSGASSLYYKGQAELGNVRTSGASTIKKVNSKNTKP